MRRLLWAVAALALAASAVPLHAAQAQTVTSYDFFQAAGQADGVSAYYEIVNLLPINRIADVSTATAESRLERTRSTALAVLPYPGEALTELPGLVAGVAQIPNLPTYPLAARAEHPFNPTAEVSLAPGGTESGFGAVTMSAHAGAESADGTAFVTDFQGPGIYSIGSVHTSSVSRALSPTQFEARAVSELGDLQIAGGLIRIESITSTVEAVFADGEAAVRNAGVAVGGVTVAGQPARITENGLELVGTAAAPPLDLAGVLPPGSSLRQAQVATEESPGRVTVRAGGVVYEVQSQVQGAPTTFRLSFGAAEVAVGATGPRTGAAAAPPSTGSASRPSTVSAPAAVPAGSGSVSALPPRPGTGGLPAAATPASGSGDGGVLDAEPTVAVDPIDFEPIYPWLALSAIAVLAAVRWTWRRANQLAAPRSDLRSLWRW